MDLLNSIKKELNDAKTLTTNGAIAYKTSGNLLLDFNFKITALRSSDSSIIRSDYEKMYYDNPRLALKYLFYLADIREGLGERHIFRSCMDWLCENKPEVAIKVLDLIPEYSRWDNLVRLIEHPQVKDKVLEVIELQLFDDLANMSVGKPVSLLAKWMPSENASSSQTKRLATIVRKALGMSSKEYRQDLSILRSYLEVIETKISANKWEEIDYEKVPSKANVLYRNAFLTHDYDRRDKFLSSLSKGEVKINASTLQPSDIVSQYTDRTGWWMNVSKDYDASLEELWKNLPKFSSGNSIVVRDGSGSMGSRINSSGSKLTCLDVATALAIYMAEQAEGLWHNKFITFSAEPKIVEFENCSSLRDKLNLSYNYSDMSNTNIYKTMRLILDAAINNNLTQEDMPNNIIIVSDMQFDGGYYGFSWDESLFDRIQEEYKKAGYLLPKIIFWNVAGRQTDTIPMQNNELGLILCSGYSVQTLKMLMSNKLDPLQILLEQINCDRYNIIDKRIENVI